MVLWLHCVRFLPCCYSVFPGMLPLASSPWSRQQFGGMAGRLGLPRDFRFTLYKAHLELPLTSHGLVTWPSLAAGEFEKVSIPRGQVPWVNIKGFLIAEKKKNKEISITATKITPHLCFSLCVSLCSPQLPLHPQLYCDVTDLSLTFKCTNSELDYLALIFCALKH